MKPTWPRPKDFESFEAFDQAWHASFKKNNPNWMKDGMYCNAQYDELPHLAWEERTE